MDNNKQLLKQLTQGKGGDRKSSGLKIPGLEPLKKALGKTSGKQLVDVVLFSAGIYIMYKFGKSVADTIDNQMPTEKSMMEMMKSMQGGPGMPPPPM